MTEEMKSNLNRLLDEAINKKNLDALDEIYTSDYIRHSPSFPDLVGLDALKEYFKTVFKTYPDMHIEIDEMVMSDDIGASRFTWTATHLGKSESLNVEATGKKVMVTGTSFSHFVDGKVFEEWVFQDIYGLMQQLGVIAAMSEPA